MENNVMQHCSSKESLKHDKSQERTQADKLFDNTEYKNRTTGLMSSCASVLQATSTLVVNALPQPNRSQQFIEVDNF